MNTGVISMRYAKALLEYALEQGDEDAVYADMKQLIHTLQTIKDLPVMLRDPMLSIDRREELLCAVTDNSSSFRRFAHLVVKEERVDLLIFMAHCYISLYRKKKRIIAVTLTTAVPASDSFKEELARKIKGDGNETVELEAVVDPSIIGGFVCEVDSRRLDASVSSRIREVRKLLVEQNRKIV